MNILGNIRIHSCIYCDSIKKMHFMSKNHQFRAKVYVVWHIRRILQELSSVFFEYQEKQQLLKLV
jgi:hypothetical protein